MIREAWLALGLAVAAPMWAETETTTTNKAMHADTTKMPDVRVYGEATGGAPGVEHLPDTTGTFIYEGKKTSVVNSDEAPPVIDNNFRQEFSQLPGLLVSEMTIPSQVNLNYRGVGDPHESEYLLQLKDGVPIVSDWFGYSTVYYAPPLGSIAQVQLIRGGSALLYGPQPGAIINYVTRRPPLDKKFTASTLQIGGSYDLYSTYNEAAGTVDRLGYLAYYDHTQSDGPRDNSDYHIDTGGVKLLLDADRDARWIFDFYGYSSESGEAGRLSPAQWESNPDFTRTPDDRIWIERYVPSITYERDLSDTSLLEVKAWGGYQDRFSRRQTGGGASANLDRQEFNFGGLDARLAHQYEAWENDHTFTGGATTYFSSSPRSRHLGTPRTDTSGTPVFDLDRYTYYGAVFAENRFRFGKFAVVPALRLEFVSLDVKENSNSSVTRSLIDDSYISVVPLGGLGLTYDLPAKNQVYANFSTSYRPKEYDDLANPTSNTQQSPSGLDESYVYQYEIGVRGQPATWCAYDTSLFFIDYDNVIETQVIGAGPDTERSNSGQARYYGWEGAAEADLIGIVDALADTQHGEKIGKLNLYGNVSLLHAEFVDGQFEGNRPSYAPDYIVKSGALYRLRDNVKVAMQGQFVGDYFWQDSNGAGTVGTKEVPSYVIWDLTGEIAVWKKLVSFVGGINNIFDRDYYSRVRADGIEPLPGRTFYAGVRIAWP